MGARGPKPKPREVKERQGTLEKSREPVNPARPRGELGAPPRGMPKKYKDIFLHIADGGWWLGDTDRLMVLKLIEAMQDYDAVSAKISNANDMVFVSKDTAYTQLSAWMSTRMKLRAEVVRYLGLIGFDPASRGKIETGGKPPDGAAEEFLFGGPKAVK